MPFRATHDRLNSCDQLGLVERLDHKVVGADAEALDLGVHLGPARHDQDRRAHAGRAQPAQDRVTVNVRQRQIENDDVVIVKLGNFDRVLSQVGVVDDELLLAEDLHDPLLSGGSGDNPVPYHTPIA